MEIKHELLDIQGIKNSNKSLIDLFIRRTSVLTSTPEVITEKIIKDQWRKANEALSGKTDIAEIDFCNLGSFRISKPKAKKRITKISFIQEALSKNVPDTRKTEDLIKEKMTRNEKYLRDIKIKAKLHED